MEKRDDFVKDSRTERAKKYYGNIIQTGERHQKKQKREKFGFTVKYVQNVDMDDVAQEAVWDGDQQKCGVGVKCDETCKLK